jgi:hypothetical protein
MALKSSLHLELEFDEISAFQIPYYSRLVFQDFSGTAHSYKLNFPLILARRKRMADISNSKSWYYSFYGLLAQLWFVGRMLH